MIGKHSVRAAILYIYYCSVVEEDDDKRALSLGHWIWCDARATTTTS